eukprot:2365619-Prorocentrum_lima.AAC.1
MVMFWSLIPCYGGSTGQYVNMANYRRRNDVEAMRRLRDLWRIYRKLWWPMGGVLTGVTRVLN